MKNYVFLLAPVALMIAGLACSKSEVPIGPTWTPTPTDTPTTTPTMTPSNTPVPTNTPIPTDTPTNTPTFTPTPSSTPGVVVNQQDMQLEWHVLDFGHKEDHPTWDSPADGWHFQSGWNLQNLGLDEDYLWLLVTRDNCKDQFKLSIRKVEYNSMGWNYLVLKPGIVYFLDEPIQKYENPPSPSVFWGVECGQKFIAKVEIGGHFLSGIQMDSKTVYPKWQVAILP